MLEFAALHEVKHAVYSLQKLKDGGCNTVGCLLLRMLEMVLIQRLRID